MVTVKDALDSLFVGISFDETLYKRIVRNNVEFITKNNEHKQLFGNRLIGNHIVKYTTHDKNVFYSNIFDTVTMDDLVTSISTVTTINPSFKIARDDVNLVCFYIAHRFMSNSKLSNSNRVKYAIEILNYFNYRTLVLLSSNYFVYPVSEQKALSLTERLSNKFIIKKVKNWNEYVKYRSNEYMLGKFKSLLITLDNDTILPNAIVDLFNRTKDTLKNIYREFLDMIEKEESIVKKSSTGKDVDGNEVLSDRLNTPEVYTNRLISALSDKTLFVREDIVSLAASVVSGVQKPLLLNTVKQMTEYSYISNSNYKETTEILSGVMINAIEYLSSNSMYISNKSSLVTLLNSIVGNVLYARGENVSVNSLKSSIDKYLIKLYKEYKVVVPKGVFKSTRNALYIYIFVLAVHNKG